MFEDKYSCLRANSAPFIGHLPLAPHKKDPDQGIEDLVDRPVADRFLGNLDLLAKRREETPTPQILAEGAQTRTPRVRGVVDSVMAHSLRDKVIS